MQTSCKQAACGFHKLPLGITDNPIDIIENSSVELHSSSFPDDSLSKDVIYAPPCISADIIEFSPDETRVAPGRAAGFNMNPTGSSAFNIDVLSALASVTQAYATLFIPSHDGIGAVDTQMPVKFTISTSLFCVRLEVDVPPGTPDGSLVKIHRVWVAGCEVCLDDPPLCITVGFNHAPSLPGKVFTAAKKGDETSLFNALLDNGSTEESARDGTALIVAIRNGHIGAARRLVACGANVNTTKLVSCYYEK
jgi:hypothetical protein